MHDLVIVGQGLAGSILAMQLIDRGADVLVLDPASGDSASRVAAGLINPVTGHRLNITQGFSDYWPEAEAFYQRWQARLDTPLFKVVPQRRLIKNQGQYNYLQQRLEQAEYADILGDYSADASEFCASQHFGSIEVLRTAVVNAPALLDAVRGWLQQRDSYRQLTIRHADISSNTKNIRIGTIETRQLVFCEGARAIDNPWLKHLPFAPAKGEVVRVQHAGDAPEQLLNWGTWLAPTFEDGVGKLGSTYVWDEFTGVPDPQRVEKLLLSARSNCAQNVTMLDSEAGVRPSTSDRKPIIGSIEALPSAWCFNGFGSKGCLLIPRCARLLTEVLLKQEPVSEEAKQLCALL